MAKLPGRFFARALSHAAVSAAKGTSVRHHLTLVVSGCGRFDVWNGLSLFGAHALIFENLSEPTSNGDCGQMSFQAGEFLKPRTAFIIFIQASRHSRRRTPR